MRICLISREYPPDTCWGGIGAYTYQIAHGLKELGHDVEVIALATSDKKTNESAPVEGILVHRVAWNHHLSELATVLLTTPYAHYVLKTSIALWNRFAQMHEEKPFDVVEAPEHIAEALFPSLTKAAPLSIRLHTPHSKFIQEQFHNFTPSFDHRLIGILERVAMLSADVLSSPSADLASYVANDCGLVLKDIAVIPYPIDTEKFSPDGPKALQSDGRLTVLFVGRLEERKGVHFLIEALPKVVKAYSNVRFVLVGADTNTAAGNRSFAEYLKEMLRQSGCEDYVQFIPAVKHGEISSYYRSADISIVPSLYDNAPFTCLEAMSCGRPVIATSAGGSKEYALHGESGFIIPPGDSGAIADALIELLTNEDKRLKLGQNARTRILANFTRKESARKMVELYKIAIEQYKAKKESALYLKDRKQMLIDTQNLLFSYHQALYDLIYLHSIRFRIKHWFGLVVKRPKLCAAKLTVEVCNPVIKMTHGRPAKLAKFVDKLKNDIAGKENQRFELVARSLGK